MRSASVAEWIVSRFTDKKRATSVVGDLVELEPQKGLLWFWISLAGVVVSLSWRRILAFIAAFYATGKAVTAIGRIHMQQSPPDHPWMSVLMVLSVVGIFLWMALIYLSIRYGFQDEVTQLALASTALVTAVIFYWWQPVILYVCIGLGIAVATVSILNTERCKAGLVLLVTLITGFASFVLAMYWSLRYTRFVDFVHSGPMGEMKVQNHASANWMFFCLFLIATWMTTAACSRMHHWLLRDKPLDEETEEGLA